MFGRVAGSETEVLTWQEWGLAAALVIAAHGAIIGLLIRHLDFANADSGSPVVMMELAPTPVSPTSAPHDLVTGPLQLQPPSETRVTTEMEPPTEKKLDEPLPTLPLVPNAQATLPTPASPTLTTEIKATALAQQACIAQPEATAPPSAAEHSPQAAAPAPGKTPGPPSIVIANWQRQLVVHLQKLKRYPQNARSAQGIVTVTFAIDRAGHIVESRILKSSGSDVLDAEALANIKRAEPLLVPPNGVAGTQLSFTLPIRYVSTGRANRRSPRNAPRRVRS